MVKRGWLPSAGTVADFAGLGEAAAYVVGILGAVEIFQVARNAGCDRNVVVVVDVATRARGRDVEARERPTGRRVVKLAIRPKHGVMALFASGREARVSHRSGCVVKVFLVARNARRNRNVVVVVDVAAGARGRNVRAGERERGLGVVKRRWLPSRCVVANLAGLGKSLPNVVRILGALEILQMARDAVCNRNAVVVVDVAARTRCSRVLASQRE